MTAYVAQNPVDAGAQLTLVTPANGDTIQPGPTVMMIINGPSSASATVGIPLPPEDTLPGPVRSVTVASGQTWLVPVHDSVYGAAPVTLAWSGTLTGAAVAVVSP